jgi:hypothetical protein
MSGAGSTRRFAPVDQVRLVGNEVQIGSQLHSVASYAAGLWFLDNGQETYEQLRVENPLEIHFESPAQHRTRSVSGFDGVEVVDAEIRIDKEHPIARLDDLLQNWYLRGSTEAWPVVVLQASS